MTLYNSFRKADYKDLPPEVFKQNPHDMDSERELYEWFINSMNIDPTSSETDVPELNKRFDLVKSVYSDPNYRKMALFLAGKHPIGLMDDRSDAKAMKRAVYALAPTVDKDSVSYVPKEIGAWAIDENTPSLYDTLKEGALSDDIVSLLTPKYGQLNYPYMRGEDGNLIDFYANIADRPVKSLKPTDIISRGYLTDIDLDPIIENEGDPEKQNVIGFSSNPKIQGPTRTRKDKKKDAAASPVPDLLDEEKNVTEGPEAKEITEPTTKSASDLFTDMRNARKSRAQVVTDDAGNVDIVKSSTSALFKSRMRGNR